MARNIKFSLTLKDGYEVEKDIEELRKHFDLERVIHYFQMGGLQRWLRINGYREEAVQMTDLQDDETLGKKICVILGVEMPDSVVAEVDIEEIKEKNARLRRLRQYTTDEKILSLAENAVFSQEELDELIDDGVDEIVLCDASFTIPLQERGMKYYGAGRAVAVIKSEASVDFAARHIEFYQVSFDEKYQQIVDAEQKQELQAKAEESRQPKSIGVENDEKQTADWHRKAAEAGDVRSMLWLGDDLQAKERYAEAHEWYEKIIVAKGADEGCKGWAFDRLGMMYQSGHFGAGHEVTAVRYFEQASAAGCAMGTYHLAQCYDYGRGVIENEKKAVACYKEAAEAGVVDAMVEVALFYLVGTGVEESEETAFSWYQKAAQQGNAFAMTMLGDYRRDHGHYAEAYDWYQKAVEVGDTVDRGNALDALGKMYLNGYLGEDKEVTAVRYFEQASELGNVSGTLHLAKCYDNGWGVEEDVKRAFTYYLKTVEDAGDTDKSEKGEALNRLGVMYLNGDLGENDDATAAQYFAQAADVDHAWGTANLAKCYKNGWGVVLDQNRAKKLWKRAMELGDESMKQELQQEMQQELQQETPQTEQRQISAAEVLAELLGVIMSGNLFGGVHLWYWHYPVDVSGFTFRLWSRSKMRDFLEKQGGTMPDEGFFEEDEKVLGGIVLKPCQKKKEEKKNTWESLLSPRNLIPGANLIASAVELGAKMLFDTPATMVFTDAAVYFEGMCIPYGMIENVVERKGRDNCTVVRMQVSGEKEPIDLPLMNYKGIDTAAVQLFLVAAMNFDAAERKQGLTHSEQERLAKIKLVTLRDDCILDYL